MPSSRFSRQVSIPSFMLCERSPARIDGLRESRYEQTSSRIEVAMEDRLLYRVPEVAVILNISGSKVYELLGSGDLPSVKIDRTRLVPRFRLTSIRRIASSCGLSERAVGAQPKRYLEVVWVFAQPIAPNIWTSILEAPMCFDSAEGLQLGCECHEPI